MSEQSRSSDVDDLADSVRAMTAEAASLRQEVKLIDEKSKRDRKLMRMLTASTVMGVVLLLGLFYVGLENRHNGDVLRDCIEPSGHCAQRSARQTSGLVESITFRTEVERLRTEITVAEIRGDMAAVEARRQRLAELEDKLQFQQQVNEAIRNDQPIPTVSTSAR